MTPINTGFWRSVCWRLTEKILEADGKKMERDAEFIPSKCRFKGSGSFYITDKDGRIIQHTEYIAFGETLFDEHLVSPKQPYLFNGKELDTETGLYYYGARYYDPKVSIFLGVDPLVEKTGTPYAYTYNNPVNLIDPTGEFPILINGKVGDDTERGSSTYWDPIILKTISSKTGYRLNQFMYVDGDKSMWLDYLILVKETILL